ncbi:MAG: cysteine desulfurase [Pirellulaceae bacterium]|nr:cysteine desulfurase [Pirellulaceae bacterium]
MTIIYLDHNATTPIRPEVVEAMRRVWAAGHANPASQHRPGQQARWVLEHARARIAELLGAEAHGSDADRVVFTSGGTEANHLAVLGIAHAAGAAAIVKSHEPPRALISPIEHACVVGAAERLLDEGWRVDSLPVSADGVVETAKLPGLLAPETRLVSTMLANHETGVVQPVAELAETCGAAGVRCHTDAVQAAGKMPIDFHRLGVDALSISAHKFQGPVGIGALVLRAHVAVEPQLLGGHQQEGLRSGTESIALAVGMMTALELCVAEQKETTRRLAALRERFEASLRAALPQVVVHGERATRLCQTSNVAFPGVDGQVLFTALDTLGVACSIGAACDSGAAEVSPTLRAMGVSRELLAGSLRFSFGYSTTDSEIDDAVQRIIGAVRRLTGSACRDE